MSINNLFYENDYTIYAKELVGLETGETINIPLSVGGAISPPQNINILGHKHGQSITLTFPPETFTTTSEFILTAQLPNSDWYPSNAVYKPIIANDSGFVNARFKIDATGLINIFKDISSNFNIGNISYEGFSISYIQ